jgi:release factor glutamine methyltransferase
VTEQAWTVRTALDWCVGYLTEKGDEHPRRSAEWLLSAATGLSRVELYAYHDRPLAPEERETLRDGIRRRAAGEPLQYVTGEVAFRHLVVRVRPGVLIPRPETEVLVGEALVELASVEAPLVADPCTGSGVVALSIAQELENPRVWATDLSPVAVRVARENAERLGLACRVTVAEGDLLEPVDAQLRGRLDAVVSNPPYLPSAVLPGLPVEVIGFEPGLALDGGPDGLDTFRRLARDAADWLRRGGVLAVELDESRVRTAADEALEWYEEVRVVRDLAGRDRVLVARGPRKA